MQHELGARELFGPLAQPAPQRASLHEAPRRIPQLREHFGDDPVRQHRVHQNRVRLGVQGRLMAAFQLDQRRRVPPDDPLEQVRVGDQGALGWLGA